MEHRDRFVSETKRERLNEEGRISMRGKWMDTWDRRESKGDHDVEGKAVAVIRESGRANVAGNNETRVKMIDLALPT